MNAIHIKKPSTSFLLFKLFIACTVFFALLKPHITFAAPKDGGLQSVEQALEQGNWALAQQKITSAIKADPTNADAYFYQGLIYSAYFKGGRKINAAHAAYDQAIKLNPRHSEAYQQKGALYLDKGQYDLAVKNYTHAIQIEATTPSFRGRGIVYASLGEHKKAIEDFTQVLKLEPQDEHALIERAKQYLETEQYQQAIDDTTVAITQEKKSEFGDLIIPVAHKIRAGAYMMLGDKEHAISDAQKACSLGDECAALDILKYRGWIK